MRRLSSDLGVDLSGSLYANASEIPEDPDLMMSSDGETSHIYTPPPRIAARFSRPATNRRKSSAASSRRNSLSSLHSHHSNRSSHGGPQSSHLAQHLRRASIIETRKARLADRAAHAERVRLRAAMAKAAPRLSSNCEERALAAQQAREKYLAQVAATCAEEVKRAKKVAEDMKGKKAAEHLKLKWDMEEKLAEAEKRRFLYQQNVRRKATTGLPAVEEKKVMTTVYKPVSLEAAAKMIQNAWRQHQRRQAVQEFLVFGLSRESITDSDFEEVGALLSQTSFIASTAKVLKLCGLLGSEEGGLCDNANVRTFLSTYLILGHPAHVFSNKGEQEQDLITKASDLLVCFEQLLSHFSLPRTNDPPLTHLETFSEACSTFFTAFSAWKALDSTVLVQTMIAQFVELDAIWQTVKDDTNGNVAADYREGIRDNQTMLLVRLKKLAGPERSKAMIRDAIRESRKAKARPKKRGSADTQPRAAVTSTADEPSVSHRGGASMQLDNAYSSIATRAQRSGLQASELQKVLHPIPENRILVHELAIDREFIIKPHEGLQHTVNRAVFDTMRVDLEAGIGDRWIVAMADTIRERLLRLLTPGNSLHQLITEVLDTTIIENQVKMGSFSSGKFFSFMDSILPKLCAPFRDPDVRALADDQNDDQDMIERLARLMHVIDLLSLDFSNFLLSANAPTLIAEGSGYEHRRFAQDLESGSITLARTYRWWSLAKAKATAEADRRNPEGVNVSANRPTPARIYAQGLVDLSIAFGELRDIDVPETLELDRIRLLRIRYDTQKIVTIGTILLTAKNLLKRDVRSQWKAEATRIWDILKACNKGTEEDSPMIDPSSHVSVPTVGTSITHASPGRSMTQSEDTAGGLLEQGRQFSKLAKRRTSEQSANYLAINDDHTSKILSAIETAHAMPSSTKTQLASTIRRALHQHTTQQLTDPVMKLLHQRLKTHILTRCSASSASERVRATTTASSSLAASGLPEFSSQLGALVNELLKVGEVDRAAHGRWYDEVSEAVARDEAGAL
ncbi:MAG: hypothetical protein M1830_003025 [Pleopsidium flavum]|nr:MAG: hypothetical protein M1830_003025 [Pleopsidium flavum]